MLKILFFLGLFLVLTLCTIKKEALNTTANDTVHSGKKQLKMTLLLQSSYGGAIEERFRTIRKSVELEIFYRKINRTKKIAVPIPKVDFSKEIVLLYEKGETNGSATPYLEVIGKMENTIILDVLELENEGNGTNITRPFCLYKMTKTTKIMNVRLKKN